MNPRIYVIENEKHLLEITNMGDNVTQLIFPGGEPYVKLPHSTLRDSDVLIDARVGSMDEWGLLWATMEALLPIPTRNVYLFLPYFPGARGDRVEYGDGTALAAVMYAQLLNAYDLDRVFIVDPHSDVAPSAIDKVEVFTVADLLPAALLPTYDALICPDLGARKRTEAAAKALGIETVIQGFKHRDMKTGQLSGFSIEDIPEDVAQLLVVDDICDGGGTFVGLLEEALIATPDIVVDLWVTHGIFSKGPEVLKKFNGVYYTDSFPSRFSAAVGNATSFHKLDLMSVLADKIIERL